MKSILKQLGPVAFPEFTGEKIYMQPFNLHQGLPPILHRWAKTLEMMLGGLMVNPFQTIYVMVDQGVVKQGECHRRGGPHIDGNWIEASGSHGGGGGHTGGSCASPGFWSANGFKDEALVLASDVCSSVAYVGTIYGDPKVGGDCSHLNLEATERIPLVENTTYAGNVLMVHESLPVQQDCQRTLVRLNIPGFRMKEWKL